MGAPRAWLPGVGLFVSRGVVSRRFTVRRFVVGAGLLGLLLTPGCCRMMARNEVLSATMLRDLPSSPADLLTLADEAVASGQPSLDQSGRALAALEKVLRSGYPRTFEVLWRLARACFYVSEHLRNKRDKLEIGRRGGLYAREAIRLDPRRVEGHYYLALNAARMTEVLARLKYLKYFLAKAELAARLNERFDDAGPLRFLGKIYITAPAWPVSVGAPERGVEVLERAVDLCPTPLNRLFLGEAYFHDEEYEDAAEQIGLALGATGPEALKPSWKAEAEQYLQKLRGLAGSPTGAD